MATLSKNDLYDLESLNEVLEKYIAIKRNYEIKSIQYKLSYDNDKLAATATPLKRVNDQIALIDSMIKKQAKNMDNGPMLSFYIDELNRSNYITLTNSTERVTMHVNGEPINPVEFIKSGFPRRYSVPATMMTRYASGLGFYYDIALSVILDLFSDPEYELVIEVENHDKPYIFHPAKARKRTNPFTNRRREKSNNNS